MFWIDICNGQFIGFFFFLISRYCKEISFESLPTLDEYSLNSYLQLFAFILERFCTRLFLFT
jgi:hypothetical protein